MPLRNKLFFFIFLASNAMADYSLQSQSDQVPMEFLVLFKQLETQLTDVKRQKQSVDDLTEIEKSLNSQGKANILFFLKSEFYRGVLKNQYTPLNGAGNLSENLIESAQAKLKQNKKAYAPLSLFVMKSILQDITPLLGLGLIDENNAIEVTTKEDKERLLKMKSQKKWLTPWLISFSKMSVEEFNAMLSDIALDILTHTKTKARYFHFTHKNTNMDKKLFLMTFTNKLPMQEKDLSLQELKKQQKEISKKGLEPLEKMNSELPRALDQIHPKADKKQWLPK